MKKSDLCYVLFWAKRIKLVSLLGGECSKCGDKNIFHLEFHHICSDKECNVSQLSAYRWSKILKESKKCVLVCRNCHSELHLSSNVNPVKINLMKLSNKQSCSRCKYNKCSAALDFHHRDGVEKEFIISRGYRSDKMALPLDKIILEIEKCDILCRNCHQEEQVDIEKFTNLEKLIRKKVDTFKEKRKKIDRSVIFKMHRDGMGVLEISRRLNCAKSTISMALSKTE